MGEFGHCGETTNHILWTNPGVLTVYKGNGTGKNTCRFLMKE